MVVVEIVCYMQGHSDSWSLGRRLPGVFCQGLSSLSSTVPLGRYPQHAELESDGFYNGPILFVCYSAVFSWLSSLTYLLSDANLYCHGSTTVDSNSNQRLRNRHHTFDIRRVPCISAAAKYISSFNLPVAVS